MLKDFNDTPAHADELAALMKKYKINAKFNLIAFNPWPGCSYQPSSNNRIHAFSQNCRITVSLRRSAPPADRTFWPPADN